METFSIKGVFCPTKVPEPPAKGTAEGKRGTVGRGWDKNETATGVLFPWRQFFVRVNDRSSGSSRDHGWDGIIWTDFTFPGLVVLPWHLLSFSDLDLNMFHGFE